MSQGTCPAGPHPLRGRGEAEDNGRVDKSPHCSPFDLGWVAGKLTEDVGICHGPVRRCMTRQAGASGPRQREGRAVPQRGRWQGAGAGGWGRAEDALLSCHLATA